MVTIPLEELTEAFMDFGEFDVEGAKQQIKDTADKCKNHRMPSTIASVSLLQVNEL